MSVELYHLKGIPLDQIDSYLTLTSTLNLFSTCSGMVNVMDDGFWETKFHQDFYPSNSDLPWKDRYLARYREEFNNYQDRLNYLRRSGYSVDNPVTLDEARHEYDRINWEIKITDLWNHWMTIYLGLSQSLETQILPAGFVANQLEQTSKWDIWELKSQLELSK